MFSASNHIFQFLLIFSLALLQLNANKATTLKIGSSKYKITLLHKDNDSPDVLYKLLDDYRFAFGNLKEHLITGGI